MLVIVGVWAATAEAKNPSKLQQIIGIFRSKYRNVKRNSNSENSKKSSFYL